MDHLKSVHWSVDIERFYCTYITHIQLSCSYKTGSILLRGYMMYAGEVHLRGLLNTSVDSSVYELSQMNHKIYIVEDHCFDSKPLTHCTPRELFQEENLSTLPLAPGINQCNPNRSR